MNIQIYSGEVYNVAGVFQNVSMDILITFGVTVFFRFTTVNSMHGGTMVNLQGRHPLT